MLNKNWHQICEAYAERQVHLSSTKKITCLSDVLNVISNDKKNERNSQFRFGCVLGAHIRYHEGTAKGLTEKSYKTKGTCGKILISKLHQQVLIYSFQMNIEADQNQQL